MTVAVASPNNLLGFKLRSPDLPSSPAQTVPPEPGDHPEARQSSAETTRPIPSACLSLMPNHQQICRLRRFDLELGDRGKRAFEIEGVIRTSRGDLQFVCGPRREPGPCITE